MVLFHAFHNLANCLVSMANSLPEEIIFYEILNRVPSVKFLIRLTLVCKRWLSLIKNPGPINSHLAHTCLNLDNSTSTSIVVHALDYYPRRTSDDIIVLHNNNAIFHNINDSVVEICDQIFRFKLSLVDVESNDRVAYLPVGVKLIDSVHGLVCFSQIHAQQVLFIWNPVTNFFRTVLKPSSRDEILYENSAFFYDAVRGELKIMHIELLCSKEKTKSIRVHVYSCNTESWKEIKDDTLPVAPFEMPIRSVKSRPNYAYVHFPSSPVMLVAFDFYEEVFKQLPSPAPPVYRYHDRYINWMDSLGVVEHYIGSGKRVIYTLDHNSGTWYEKYVVPDSLKGCELELCLSNGDIVVQEEEKNLFLLKADQSSRFKTLIINFKAGRSDRFDVVPYTESLICIKGMQELNLNNSKNLKNSSKSKDENKKSTQLRKKRSRIGP